jgi:diguanylate cyclase (GGDEF)-like protein
MEIKRYLRILLNWWWVVAISFLVVLVATVVFIYLQRPVYEANATLLVTPRQSLPSFREALDSMVTLDRARIVTTYAQVVNSQSIRNAAFEQLQLTPGRADDVTYILADTVPNTTLIAIHVEGHDPTLVRDVAAAIADQSTSYVSALNELHELRILDPASMLETPIKPDKRQNIVFGVLVGLVLGVGGAFFAEYLREPAETVASLSIMDKKTGAYTGRYFRSRLREEMSRAQRHNYPLSIGLMRIDNDLSDIDRSLPAFAKASLLRKVTSFLKQYLREEELIATWHDEHEFALLLPDSEGQAAQERAEQLQTRLAWQLFEIEEAGIKLNLSASFGLVTYNCNGVGEVELLASAESALAQAQLMGPNAVMRVKDDNNVSD